MSERTDVLAVDLGAESGRGIIGAFDGERLALREVRRFPNVPVRLPAAGDAATHLHWDILLLWHEVQETIAAAARDSRAGLTSVGVDTWGVDFALLDRSGALLGNPYHYRDDRTDGHLAEAFRRVPREAIFEQTGIQFLQFNTLFQLLSMVLTHSPLLEAAETLLTIPDLINYWLTGRKVCEFSNATTTQCYDPRQGDWARQLLSALEIPTHIFPSIVSPGTVLGEFTPTVARELDVEKLPVIAPACHDTGSAVAAIPAHGADFAYISSGTWSLIGAEVAEPLINAQTLAFNLTNEGGVAGTFRLLKNVMGLWLVQECKRTWEASGERLSYAELTQRAADAPPLRSIIDPDSDEFLKPGDMPARIRAYCQRTGQPTPESKGAIVRCALESLALKYRWVLERLEEMLGHRLRTIHIVGGGSKNTLLNQFTADAAGRQVVAGPVEATAIGNIVVQMIALGYIDSLTEGRRLIEASFDTMKYDPAGGPAWDAAYEKLLAVMAAESA
jgi:rhamnulokinase